MKVKHISLKTLRKKAWELISRYVRKSAADENGIVLCYTCGKPHYWTDMDCGHYIHKDCLDYDLINLHPQCGYCNRRLHGNRGIYAERLIAEYGESAIVELRIRSEEIKKFNIVELEGYIETYKARLAEMEIK
jgi:hypothetical protein